MSACRFFQIVNRQIVRIWKGYRDATVAWVNSSDDKRTALFLAIFAPRRALLEVWNVQVQCAQLTVRQSSPESVVLERR